MYFFCLSPRFCSFCPVFMLKNRISFDNTLSYVVNSNTIWRCDKQWTLLIRMNLEVKTSSAHTHKIRWKKKKSILEFIFFERKINRKIWQNKKIEWQTVLSFFSLSLQIDRQWNKFNLIRNTHSLSLSFTLALLLKGEKWANEWAREIMNTAQKITDADTLISELFRLLHWFTEQLKSDKNRGKNTTNRVFNGQDDDDETKKKRN